MKLLTLLTTLIITLASSNVFAKTFMCENWKKGPLHGQNYGEQKGTMFVGEKKENMLIIKNSFKYDEKLILLGKSNNGGFYKNIEDSKTIKYIYALRELESEGYDYDFTIVVHSHLVILVHTFCNWQ